MAPLRASLIAMLGAFSAASAAAVARQAGGFALTANSTDGPAFHASGGFFWLGKSTSTFCPETVACGSFSNTTSVRIASNGATTMSAAVPGGQAVFIASDGALGFTDPELGNAPPPGSVPAEFGLVAGPDNEQFLTINGIPNDGFVTCGSDGQVFAVAQNLSCDGPTIRLIPLAEAVTQPGAYEYA